MEILKVEDLSFTYPLCKEKTLESISFGVQKGEFVTLCGATGSGKSTLLRLLKRELAPLGEREGRIYIASALQEELDAVISACSVGFVMQNPEQQIVTDKVWHELAFGLENMGVPREIIARRTAEMASYFGIEDWYDRRISELSGGQKQLLNLASVMVMQPKLLILDEPTAQLDPIAASDFIATLKKINRELSMTVIIAEHRLEELIPASDRLLILEKGRVRGFDEPETVVAGLGDTPELLCSMPSASRLYHMVEHDSQKCPLGIREGRAFIESNYNNHIKSIERSPYTHSDKIALEFKDVCFRYAKDLPDVLRGLDLKVYENEIFCILGGNGSGKSTALSCGAALEKPYSGSIRVFGKKLKEYKGSSLYKNCLTLLPQDVQTVFLRNTVAEELEDAGAVVKDLPFDISHLYDKHPYDLSGGEQQLVALAKVLAAKPEILLMDEPTKGLDAYSREGFIKIIKQLKAEGMTIVTVTHDVEFAALCADRCGMFFRGNILSCDVPYRFFTENNFYTTAACRMTRGFYDGAVTLEDAAELCRRNGGRA